VNGKPKTSIYRKGRKGRNGRKGFTAENAESADEKGGDPKASELASVRNLRDNNGLSGIPDFQQGKDLSLQC
jgi:hypothetical protein